MPDLNFPDNTVQEAAIIYGNKFLRNDFPIGDSGVGAWRSHQTLPANKFWITSAVDQEDRMVPNWAENEDPFTQTNLLNKADDQVQELIFQIRKSFSIHLANRLLNLFNDAKEEDSASLGISVGSLRNFYNFLQLHTDIKNPTISLTPDYNIYASWRGEQKRLFSVHFLPNGDTRFVIFKPNDRHPEQQIRLSGIATVDVLLETVTPGSSINWILE